MSRRAWLCLVITISTVASLGPGCGGGEPARSAREAAPSPSTEAPVAARVDADAGGQVAAKKEAGNAQPAGDPGAKTAPVDRKVIYSAKLDLIVKDLDAAAKAVDEKLAQHAGRLVRSETRSDSGARRTATFTLEVPADKFRGLVAALKDLGVPERDAVDSQDVTEEFVDVQARLKNLREQETKLNELLKEKRKEEKLEDVIKVSDRIGEVRQQVERVEGRLKYLETRAAFSTVTLTLREVTDYKPPTAPTFGDRVGRTFGNSWDALRSFGEGLVLVAVALSVWLPLLIPVGIGAVWGLRRLVKAVNAAAPPLPVAHTRPVAPPAAEFDPNRTTPME